MPMRRPLAVSTIEALMTDMGRPRWELDILKNKGRLSPHASATAKYLSQALVRSCLDYPRGTPIEVPGAPGNHPDLDEVTWKGHIYAPPSGHNG